MKKLLVALLMGLFFVTVSFAQTEKRLGMTPDGLGVFELMDLCECVTYDDGTEVCVIEEIESDTEMFQVMDFTGDGVGDFTEGFKKIYEENQTIYVYMGKGPGPVDADKQLINELFGIVVEENSKTCN